jgi:hypothetical protein
MTDSTPASRHPAAQAEDTSCNDSAPLPSVECTAFDTASTLGERTHYCNEQAGHNDTSAAPLTPSFLHPPRPAIRTSAWHWLLLGALTLLLLLQLLLADRARLAGDARWRPLLTELCALLHCQLPVWREPQAYTMLARSVQPATDQPGVLEVQTSFRNDARWAQPWPALQLSLTDDDGRTIGSRVFVPRDYLGKPAADDEVLLPGQATQVIFRIQDLAGRTEAFAFEFH